MQAVEQKQGQTMFFEETDLGAIETIHCFGVREKLDAMFDQQNSLEETSADVKRKLFAHLETCRDCCRAFDVRLRFRPAGRRRIY